MLSSVALPDGVEVHVARGRSGRALAEVDEGGASVGQADQHEAAAADVAGGGMRHRQREADRDRRVDRVAAGFEDLEPRFGGVAFARDHHAVPRAHRLRGPDGRAAAISRRARVRRINLDSTIPRRYRDDVPVPGTFSDLPWSGCVRTKPILCGLSKRGDERPRASRSRFPETDCKSDRAACSFLNAVSARQPLVFGRDVSKH